MELESPHNELIRLLQLQRQARQDEAFGGLSTTERDTYERNRERIDELQRSAPLGRSKKPRGIRSPRQTCFINVKPGSLIGNEKKIRNGSLKEIVTRRKDRNRKTNRSESRFLTRPSAGFGMTSVDRKESEQSDD
jgi:hypothetical protein